MNDSAEWERRCTALLSQRRGRALLRARQVVQYIDATHIEIDGTRYVNFASNDYLGLTHHPRLRSAACAAAKTGPIGSGAAGLITGHSDAHARCEARLAEWKGTEAAVVLPSGYQANLAAIQTLAAIGESFPDGVRFLLDKLVHASLIDAVRATGAPMRIFPHNSLPKLRRLLGDADPSKQLQVVISESIFSMDGDAADLHGIAALKQSHPFVFLLDEAHGSGVYGPQGAGLASELGLPRSVDVSIVTLSKAVGSIGGAVCCSNLFRDTLLNFGRAYIYSTAVPPIIADCIVEAINVMRDDVWRQQRVRALALHVRSKLADASIAVMDGDSPIIPVVLGSEDTALRAAEELKKHGIFVVAVRPPTVPPSSSRLRLTVSCEHSDQEIAHLLDSVSKVLSLQQQNGR